MEIGGRVKCSAHGVPYRIAVGNDDRSRITTGTDLTAFVADFDKTNTRAEINFDVVTDLPDLFRFNNAHDDAGPIAPAAIIGSGL